MKRIAFVIFSCEVDDFQGLLEQLMKKMIEIFKQKDKKDVKQRLFLFFLTRVLLIRLNFQTLTEALRKLWPHLLNELISVFESKQEGNINSDESDLTIEAIKLIELLSSLNIEDFQMNQWIFLIDGYGMTTEDQERDEKHPNNTIPKHSRTISQDQSKNSGRLNQIKQKTRVAEKEEDAFNTFIVKFIGNQNYSFYNVEKADDA